MIKRSKNSMRMNILQYFDLNELLKVAMICKEFYHLIDPNRGLILTDDNLNIINQKEGKLRLFTHLIEIVCR